MSRWITIPFVRLDDRFCARLSFEHLVAEAIVLEVQTPANMSSVAAIIEDSSRFWLGPEGGQYSLYFKPGDPFDLAHWQVPEPIDWGAWSSSDRSSGNGWSPRARESSVATSSVGIDRSVAPDTSTAPESGVTVKVHTSSPSAPRWAPAISSVHVEGPHEPPVESVAHGRPSTVQIASASRAAIASVSSTSGTPPGRREALIASRSAAPSNGVPAVPSPPDGLAPDVGEPSGGPVESPEDAVRDEGSGLGAEHAATTAMVRRKPEPTPARLTAARAAR